MNKEQIKAANRAKFAEAKKLNLPLGHWAIASSGPMGVRGLREIRDIDIIVDKALWAQLKAKYGTKYENGLLKINVPSDLLDITGDATWADDPSGGPSIDDQIKSADMVDGLPFIKLEHVIYFKQQLGRDKDKRDIEIINKYLKAALNE